MWMDNALQGTPTAYFPDTSCDFSSHLGDHHIVINLTFCAYLPCLLPLMELTRAHSFQVVTGVIWRTLHLVVLLLVKVRSFLHPLWHLKELLVHISRFREQKSWGIFERLFQLCLHPNLQALMSPSFKGSLWSTFSVRSFCCIFLLCLSWPLMLPNLFIYLFYLLIKKYLSA